MARIGLLTGGGDCPGLNAVIRAVVRKGINTHGHEFVGFRYGWAGVLEADVIPLTHDTTSGILHRGGTILGTSRTNVFKQENGLERVRASLKQLRLDALIPIGGEDTLGVAGKLSEAGVNVVGVPKTIDNDLAGTDFTFGFQTAVQIATDAIDRLHTTAESHNRAIIVVAEGATPKDGDVWSQHAGTDAFGHARLGGIAVELEREIEQRTGFESRMTILGHVQRGGTPLAYDRVLGTRFGVAAVDAVTEGNFGRMAALRGTKIELVPLDEALAEPKLLDPELFETAEVFFG